MTPSRPLALIAAVARNGVIGTDNALPWRLPSDMRHFKATTMGKPVIMGRKTWQSIGRPLPGRRVVVVSRDAAFTADGVDIARTVGAALDKADAIARSQDAAEIIVAGGGTIYAALMDQALRLHITEVDLAPEGDTRFPPIDPLRWRATRRLTPLPSAADEAGFAFVTYDRL